MVDVLVSVLCGGWSMLWLMYYAIHDGCYVMPCISKWNEHVLQSLGKNEARNHSFSSCCNRRVQSIVILLIVVVVKNQSSTPIHSCPVQHAYIQLPSPPWSCIIIHGDSTKTNKTPHHKPQWTVGSGLAAMMVVFGMRRRRSINLEETKPKEWKASTLLHPPQSFLHLSNVF